MNAQDNQGNTPLHYCRNMLICRLLFKYEIDPLLRNRKKQTPSQFYRVQVPENEGDPDLWAELLRREEEKLRQNLMTQASRLDNIHH